MCRPIQTTHPTVSPACLSLHGTLMIETDIFDSVQVALHETIKTILGVGDSIWKHSKYVSSWKHTYYDLKRKRKYYASTWKHNYYTSPWKHNYYDFMWKHNNYASMCNHKTVMNPYLLLQYHNYYASNTILIQTW